MLYIYTKTPREINYSELSHHIKHLGIANWSRTTSVHRLSYYFYLNKELCLFGHIISLFTQC